MKYTKNNYSLNLKRYWRQYFPDYEIPKGYHVHHIKPKCTFKDRNDPAIHHPRNLIALHPDDHFSIHKLRGDKQLSYPYITSVKNRIVTEESKKKMSIAQKVRYAKNGSPLKGKTKPPFSKKWKENLSKAAIGRKASDETKAKMSEQRQGIHNVKFKGYYVTPWGEFTSLDSAAISTVRRTSVQRWCNNPDKKISKQAIWQSKYLTDSDCGKTFRELGFSLNNKQKQE